MKIKDSVALVTGANRGLGLAFAKALLAAGARKVYAGTRDPSTVPALPGLVPVRLDITNADDVAAAARACADVTLLINNAGIAQGGSFLSPHGTDAARSQLGPVNTVFARCVASQKGLEQGAKRRRGEPRQGFATPRRAFLIATRREWGEKGATRRCAPSPDARSGRRRAP